MGTKFFIVIEGLLAAKDSEEDTLSVLQGRRLLWLAGSHHKKAKAGISAGSDKM